MNKEIFCTSDHLFDWAPEQDCPDCLELVKSPGAYQQREEMRAAGFQVWMEHDPEAKPSRRFMCDALGVSLFPGEGPTENAATQACYEKWKEAEETK